MIQEVLFTGPVARFFLFTCMVMVVVARVTQSSTSGGVTAIARFLRRIDPDALLLDLEIDTTNSTTLYTSLPHLSISLRKTAAQ